MAAKVIAIASDHSGVDFKETLKGSLVQEGLQVLDLGANSQESVDYPDFAEALTAVIGEGSADWGVLICGTGIGMSIAANRKPFIRAALCHSVTDARLSRQHNNANVLILGARTLGIEIARDCLGAFLNTKFDGGRHQRRIDKMSG
ncbi:MAG: ribose 5-phosphate isomerase B [Rickettsiales bacterium]|nr:ribose 5-phosphate isomerase B [Rickettsiales bacterium]